MCSAFQPSVALLRGLDTVENPVPGFRATPNKRGQRARTLQSCVSLPPIIVADSHLLCKEAARASQGQPEESAREEVVVEPSPASLLVCAGLAIATWSSDNAAGSRLT